ncbi:MAG TPA: MFS transporter [Nocardioides sp.]|uniref:MFS transporter n=1 Tax=Nocardioides sp. TaxID=35761 RepID=UPI002ED81A2E
MTSISAMAPLREPSFRWYFLSRSVNLVGSTMAPVALAFGVLEVSHSASALGMVLAAYSIPMLAFLLLGGVLADRWGRRRVIQASNVLSGLVRGAMAVLIITGQAELWSLVALAGLNGVVVAPGMPALNGIVPQLVPRAQLQQANVLLSMTRAALMVVGPGTAAVLVVTVGPGWALAIDAVTWLAAAVLLAPVVIPAPTGPAATLVAELREGWQLFRRTTWLWLVVGAFALLNALHEGGFNTLGPVRAKETAIGATGWGWAMSVQAAGLLIATLFFLRWQLQRPLLVGMAGCALFGLPMMVLGWSPHTGPLLLAAFVSGIGIQTYSLGWHLAMQEHIPDELLSRAYSYDQLGSYAAIPIGQLAVGPLAELYGVGPVISVAGLAYVVICLATLLSGTVRGLPRRPGQVELQPG